MLLKLVHKHNISMTAVSAERNHDKQRPYCKMESAQHLGTAARGVVEQVTVWGASVTRHNEIVLDGLLGRFRPAARICRKIVKKNNAIKILINCPATELK